MTPQGHDPRATDPGLDALLGQLRDDLAQGEDASIQRVAHRLRSPAAAPSRGIPSWLAAGAMVATAALTLLVVRIVTPPPPDPTVAPLPTVAAGQELAAREGALAATLAEGGASVGLAAGTIARRLADAPSGAPVLELDHGVITVDVVPGMLPGLRVRAGQVTVSVLGTSFAVTRTPEGVDVVVLRGIVEVTSGAGSRELRAGESFTTRPPGQPADEPPIDAVREAAVAPPAPGERPSAQAPAEGEEADEPPTPTLTAVEEEFIGIQDALAAGSDAGELVAMTTGYLDRHPRGTFTAEVAAIRVEALAREGRAREAYDAAAAFVADHPRSPRRTQILQLQATVARDRLQDCALALEPYRSLAQGSSPQAAEASYYLGVCALEQGLLDEGVAALERCLALAPEGTHAPRARELLETARP